MWRTVSYTTFLLVCSLCKETWGSSGSAPLNVDVSMVTYLGDGTTGGINTGTGTAVDDSGNIYVSGAGTFNFGLHPQGDASKNGYILKLSSSNLHPNKIYRTGSQVAAMKVRQTSSGLRIMAQTDLGVVVLDGNFHQQFIAVAENCALSDCIADMGRDGTLAVLKRSSHQIEVYSETGQLTATKDLGNKHYMDVAVDPVNKRVIYAYFFQSYPHHVPVQVPCVIALDYSLANTAWRDYCVSAIEDYETHNMADSRPNHLYYSDLDNKLYLAGYTDGGNSIFRFNPLDIAQNSYSLSGLALSSGEMQPTYDKYVNTYGFHGAHSISFISRINPTDGSMEKGQFVVTRLSSGNGNSVSTQAVAGGVGGTLVAAQTATASLENRDTQTVNGQDTAGYGGGDATLLVVSPDFHRRLVWHQFLKTTGHSKGVAVAANNVGGKTRVAFLASATNAEFLQINKLSGTDHAPTNDTSQYALVVMDV